LEEIGFFSDWNCLEIGMEEVGFGLTVMAWNENKLPGTTLSQLVKK
jgi:hypothetical protein